MKEESRRATLQLVEMECSYLTVDFFRKLPQDVEKGGNPTHSIFDRYNDSYLRRIGEDWIHGFCHFDYYLLVLLELIPMAEFCTGSTVLSYVNMVCGGLRNSIPKSVVYCQVREAKRSLLDYFFTELGKKEVFHSSTDNFESWYRKLIIWSVLVGLQGRQLGKLLDEDPAIMQRRVSIAKRLELYRAAQAEIDNVAWSK